MVWDAEHVPTHAPFKHASACAQVVPHAPQLSCDDVVSTHAPEQVIWPIGQDGAASTVALSTVFAAFSPASVAVVPVVPDEHAESALAKNAQHVERNMNVLFMDRLTSLPEQRLSTKEKPATSGG
jgi:hypothetical protein